MRPAHRIFAPILGSCALLTLLPAVASACSVCMGANSRTGPAINGAIFLMLGFVAFILSSLGAFAYGLAKRARSPLPPDAEIAQTTSSREDTK